MITALLDERTPACASAASTFARPAPPRARPPIFKKLRRVIPSQNGCLSPRIVSTAEALPENRLPAAPERVSPPGLSHLFRQPAASGVTPIGPTQEISRLSQHRGQVPGKQPGR